MKKIALALLLGSICYSSVLTAKPTTAPAPATAAQEPSIEQITQLAQKVTLKLNFS
ncbi:hypothetical protein AB7263_17160 [Providencia rettgeri]